MSWLAAQQAPDGSWADTEDTRLVDTAEVLAALQAYQQRTPTYQRGIAWLEARSPRNHDERARRIAVLARHGDSVANEAQQLAAGRPLGPPGNGGWGLSPWYDGGNLDTALALRAFTATDDATHGALAVEFLKDTVKFQSNLFGWSAAGPLHPSPAGGLLPDLSTTSMAIQALQPYLDVDPVLIDYLSLAAQSFAAGWTPTSAADRALVVLALAAGAPSVGLSPHLDPLVLNSPASGGQDGDGSWEGSVRTTALAVHALAVALQTHLEGNDVLLGVPDFGVRSSVNSALGRNAADAIHVGDILQMTSLVADGIGISDLTGLEAAANLTHLDLSNNAITDLTPILGLPLTYLVLAGNPLNWSQDLDGDGLVDGMETGDGIWRHSGATGTLLTNPDTDGDGILDADDDYPHHPQYSSAAVAPWGFKLDLNRAQEPHGAPEFVGLDDFLIFWASYGKQSSDPGFHPDCDFDGDGHVDLADFIPILFTVGTGWVPPEH